MRCKRKVVLLTSLVIAAVFPRHPALAACKSPYPPSKASRPVASQNALNEASEFWARVRKAYPLHVQGTFMQVAPSGETALVVAEPPPHATLEDIKTRLAATGAEVRTHKIGADGWVKDVIAVLGRRNRESAEESLARLDGYLYGTSYRARALDAGRSSQQRQSRLDVQVSPAELRAWVLGDGAAFHALDGTLTVIADQLRQKTVRGVFASAKPGLVIWTIPTGTDLCLQQAEARQFALQSDLVLGAVATPNHVVVVGRERLAPPEEIGPLRFESLLPLASARVPSLAQSFQRRNLFAGKLRSGNDWAPILLSDELQGTEFGSLLNIADQMLKSWSMNGQVRYENSRQVDPPLWADAKPVIEQLRSGGQTSQLTFNWNTTGLTSLLEDDEVAVLTVQRTGALPITFIPEHAHVPRAAAVEERYHDYFASLEEPVLARVVAYTALFEIFQTFQIKAKCSQPHKADHSGEAFLEGQASRFLSLAHNRDRTLGTSAEAQPGGKGKDEIERLGESINVVREKSGDEGLVELAHYLGGVRGPTSRREFHKEIFDIAKQLSAHPQVGELAKEMLSADDALAGFAASERPVESPWLRTPAFVVSRVEAGENVVAVGGHNLDVLPVVVNLDPSVARRRPRLEKRDSRTTLVVNPNDVPTIKDAVVTVAKVQNGRMSENEAVRMLAADFARGGRQTIREPQTALGFEGRSAHWLDRPSAGWAVAAPAMDQPNDSAGSNVIRIRRARHGFELTAPDLPLTITASSTITFAEYVNGLLSRGGQKEMRLQLEGFTTEQANAFRNTLRLRWNHRPRPDILVISDGTSAADRPFERKGTTLVMQEPRKVEMDGVPMFEYTARVKNGSLLMRIVLYFKDRIGRPTGDAIRSVIERVLGRSDRTAVETARDIRAELRNTFPDGVVDVFVEEQEVCDYILAERTPDAPSTSSIR